MEESLLRKEVISLEQAAPLYTFYLGSFPVVITLEIVTQWGIILFLALLGMFMTKKIDPLPNKKQNISEIFVETVSKLVEENMGEEYLGFVPFIGTVIIYVLIMNLTGLIGIKPPTQNLSITLSLGIITFFIVQATAIKKVGIFHYFIGYGKPYVAMVPLNIIERFMLPVSLSLRLFGNITAGTIIVELVYQALNSIGFIATLGLPIALHFYFDIFDGVIQVAIFTMLTMINIKLISEH